MVVLGYEKKKPDYLCNAEPESHNKKFCLNLKPELNKIEPLTSHFGLDRNDINYLSKHEVKNLIFSVSPETWTG